MKIIATKDEVYKTKWDNFLVANSNGNHLQLTDWLNSYRSYGFDYELILALENDEIIGGFGAVIAKVGFFKFYCISGGPIVKHQNLELLKKLFIEAKLRAEKNKTCYIQINAPILNDLNKLPELNVNLKENNFKTGNLFKYVYSSNGLNWLDFKKYNSSEEILLDFKSSSVRRNIRSAERKETEIKFLKKELEVKNAYDLCLLNAKNNNYSIRDWESFKPTIINLINKNWLQCIASFKDNELKGAIFIVKSGNYYTYILGGTKKEKPELWTGYLLQWEAIKYAFDQKCSGYNVSLGGSNGVIEFKKSFVSEQILYENTKYYSILKPRMFKIFLFFDKKIKPYKKNIASILAKIKTK